MRASSKCNATAPWPTLRTYGRTRLLQRISNHQARHAELSVSAAASETYDLKWLVRTKVDRLPGNADERDRAKFKKAASYMVLLDDKVMCKNMRCRKRFDVSGVKTTAFI